MRLLMPALCKNLDHVVLTAGKAAEALQLANGLKLNLCILDVRLPDGTGIELCQRLRKLQPDVPIVITPPTQRTLNMPRCLVAETSLCCRVGANYCRIAQSKRARLKPRLALRVQNFAAAITQQKFNDFRNGDRNRSRPNYSK